LLQAASPVNILVPKGRAKDVQTTLQHSPYFEAPIAVSQSMGLASLTLDGVVLAETPLVATSAINSAGWWKRFVDSVKLSINSLLSD